MRASAWSSVITISVCWLRCRCRAWVDEYPPTPYSRNLLVRWLSGRKQRFAKAPYPKRVPRVRIPPSPPLHFRFDFRDCSLPRRSLGEGGFDWRDASRARVTIRPPPDSSPEPKRSFG